MGVVIPISRKLNPANSQLTQPKQDWPPVADRPRISAYRDYRSMYAGAHEDVLDERHLAQDYDVYLAVNLPAIIPRIPADILCGEPITREYEDNTPEAGQDIVEAIWDRNELQTAAYEQAIDTGVYGDGLYCINRNEAGEAVVTGQNPEHWYPVFDPADQRNVLLHRLAWEMEAKDDRGNDVELLRMIEHDRGEVRHRLFLLEQGQIKREAADTEWAWLKMVKPPDMETGVDDFLLIHVPNFRSGGQYMGRSDYQGVEPLYGALDARVTQYDQILHRHANPSLAMPGAMFQHLDEKNGLENVQPEDLRFLRMDADTGQKPEYMTWNGQLADSREFISILTNQILMQSEIDRQLVNAEGMGAVSGRALRVLLMRTLAKVGRKRMYQKPALEKVLKLAQQVEGKEPVPVTLRYSDGLPQDRLEDVEISERMVAAGFSSTVREIMKLRDVDRAEAENIMAEVAEEGDAARNDDALANQVGGGGIGRTPINVNVNAEDLQ